MGLLGVNNREIGEFMPQIIFPVCDPYVIPM